MRNYKLFATGTDLIKVRLAATACGLGLASMMPQRITIERSTDDLGRYLNDALEADLLPSIYIGPRRAVEKPVLQLIDSSGRTIAFVKVGVNDQTRALVRAEGANLIFLHNATFRKLVVPEVLHRGRWGQHEVLVQRALRRSGKGQIDKDLLDQVMLEIALVRGTDHRPLSETGFWARLCSRVESLAPSVSADVLRRTLNELAPHRSREVIMGSWHGDWGPWNMTSSQGRLLAWDWEHFESGVPLGLDAIHHKVHGAALESVAPEDAFAMAVRDADSLLAPFGLTGEAARFQVLLYALEIATRYAVDGEPQRGDTTMGRLDWLERVLGRLSALMRL
ncbi:hypothetical protein [Nostocoides japonicum]|uniref:hypothetical protein n=1 Tax=Nostocoides japonicum TaxID=99481 RepID=UPI00138F6CD8|nr:hypothetical protein [Tetrasphaera japonica]